MPRLDLVHVPTYADLVAVPDHLVAEIVGRELWTSPRPAPRHARASMRLATQVNASFGPGGGPGGWEILAEPELHLAEHVLVPDIAGWRRVRLPRLPDTAYFALAPDWVCEVLSSSTAVLDRVKKLPVYAAHGVKHAWLVDPILRTLEVLRLEGAHWALVTTCARNTLVRAEPFEAVEMSLGLLWADETAADESGDQDGDRDPPR